MDGKTRRRAKSGSTALRAALVSCLAGFSLRHYSSYLAEAPSAVRRRWAERRFRLATALGLVLATLLVVLAVGGRFILEIQAGNAAAPLPVLDALVAGNAPRFLFSINGVNRPLGVAVSPNGDRIYVTESEGQRETKVFDRDGRPVGALNPPDSGPASRVPVYVAVNPEGKVYVSDRRAKTIQIYSPAGEYLGYVPPPDDPAGSWAPLALSFDTKGNLLVSDLTTDNHRLVLLAPDGTLLRQVGGPDAGDASFSYPNGVATDRAGRAVVADSNNGRVAVVDLASKTVWSFGRGATSAAMGMPRGLVIDDRNRVYVADTINHTVLVFDLSERQASLLFTLGAQGINDGEFNFPNGLAIDRGGRLYVTDRENNRVQVWTY